MTFASIMGNLYAVEFASLQYTSSSWVLYRTMALLSGRMTARVCLPFCTANTQLLPDRHSMCTPSFCAKTACPTKWCLGIGRAVATLRGSGQAPQHKFPITVAVLSDERWSRHTLKSVNFPTRSQEGSSSSRAGPHSLFCSSRTEDKAMAMMRLSSIASC